MRNEQRTERMGRTTHTQSIKKSKFMSTSKNTWCEIYFQHFFFTLFLLSQNSDASVLIGLSYQSMGQYNDDVDGFQDVIYYMCCFFLTSTSSRLQFTTLLIVSCMRECCVLWRCGVVRAVNWFMILLCE